MKRKCGLLCALALAGGFADAQVLTWNGAGGAAWDAASVSWVDEGNVPSAWVPGAVAKFDGAGGLVEVSADVSASGLVFASGGYALVGGGRIRLEGDLSVDAGATNSVGVEIFSASGIAKTGLGAVALGQCVGKVSVSAGDLLACASQFADAQVAVAAGARIVTAGEPDRALNMILNAGFEDFPRDPGTWGYNPSIAPWYVTQETGRVGLQNVAAATAWSAAGVAPEGSHTLILQYGGAVAQVLTVAQAGWHQVAFYYFLRSTYAETVLYASLDGVTLAMIVNDVPEYHARRFVSVPVWLEAGTHTLGLAAEDRWGDRTSMVDDVCVAPAFSAATACQSLGGDSEVSLAAGAYAVRDHAGNLDVAKLNVDPGAVVSGSGAWGAPMAGFWFEYLGGVWDPALALGMDAFLRVRDSGTLTLEGEARRVWASGAASVAIDGAGLTLTNAVPALGSQLTVDAGSAVAVAAPLDLRQWTALDVFGTLAVDDAVALTNKFVSKRGTGAAAFAQPLTLYNPLDLLEGQMAIGAVTMVGTGDRGGCVSMLTLPGRAAGLTMRQPGITYTAQHYFGGRGEALWATGFGGGELSITGNSPRTAQDTPLRIDVAGGDTLSLPRLLVWIPGGPAPLGGLLKSGAGLLEFREGGANNGNDRTYLGRTILRNGTLRVLADDVGDMRGALAYTGTTPDGRGGPLGAGPLTNAVWVGDGETLPADDLTFVASGNKRYIGHDFEVFNVGNDVRFEVADSTEAFFAGTFTLHRGVTFAGPGGGAHLILNGVQGAGDVALEGFTHVTVLDAISGGINLNVDAAALTLSKARAAASVLDTFTMGDGVMDLYFGGGAHSRIEAADITLGEVALNLYYQGTETPYSEPGVYALAACSGTLAVNPAALSVANAVGGFSYAFSVAGNTLTLTIQSTSPGDFAVWASPDSGAWDTGANWNPAAVPDSAALSVLMGGAIASNATVTLGSSRTVGELLFNHPLFGYTLDGAALTFGGATPRLDVLNGAHTILNTLAGAGPLAVAVQSGKLTLGNGAAILPPVLLEQGTLTVSGANAALGAGLEGAADTALALEDGSRLTVAQAAAGTFSGFVQGAVNTALVKDGPGAWTLDDYTSWHLGAFHQAAGKTVLEGVPLYGTVTADAGATLAVAPAATNGLMGHYYHVGDSAAMNAYSNAFLSITALEAAAAARGTPTLISPSGLDGEVFDYPAASDSALSNLPYPFGSGGPHLLNFFAIWRGSITLPESGLYSFSLWADDFQLMTIDGNILFSNNRYENTTLYNSIELSAGRHDIFVGLGQVGGGVGIRLGVHCPSDPPGSGHAYIPNSWLSPATALGAFNGAGQLALQAGASAVVGAKGFSLMTGPLASSAGSLLTKVGNDVLDLRGGAANQAQGDVVIRTGRLAVSAENLIGDATPVTVASGAAFSVIAPQTIGALSGAGRTILGNAGDVTVDVFPFTDETDSGISPSKNYTHLVDLPLTQDPFATINGVTFDKNANWSWVSAAVPDGAQGAVTETGIDRLLRGFIYNKTDFTFRLTALQPFTAYEFCLYFRNYGGNPRDITVTFTTGLDGGKTINHNPDTLARSIIRCCYVTEATGTLDVRIVSHNGSHTCHLYAFSNEETGGSGSGSATATLTLAPAAGEAPHYWGPLSGKGTVIVDGAGAQVFDGANRTDGGLAVLAGGAVLGADASVSNGVSIAAGAAVTVPQGAATLGGLTGSGTLGLPGDTSIGYARGRPYLHFFTNDVTSQISPAKVYTHALDFGSRAGTTIGGPGATVNNVAFLKADASGTNPQGYGWNNFGTGTHAGNTFHLNALDSDEGVFTLLTDLRYNNAAGTTASLTGLTPGRQYEVRFYNRWWDSTTANRTQTLQLYADPAEPYSISFNPDTIGPNFLGFRYTAAASGSLTLVFGPEGGTTYHLYALTNEEIPEGQDAPPPGTFAPSPWGATPPGEPLYLQLFTDEATCQISPLKRYTHKLDFGTRDAMVIGAPGATVNGVTFVKASARGTVVSGGRTYGWSGFGGGTHGGSTAHGWLINSPGLFELMRDMSYAVASSTAHVTGLTPGQEYEMRIYLRRWDEWRAGGRVQDVRFTSDPAVTNAITIYPDHQAPHILAYRYTASANGTVTMLYTAGSADSWHIYAMTNEEIHNPDECPLTIDVDNRTDTFGGDITGGQRWEKRGNGTLLLTGNSTATGPLTVNGGALGVDLNGVATLGPVLVQNGSLLFGSGAFGGDVYVTADSGLHAGTAAACGTLAIGGLLTLEDGARLDWRYGAKPAADTTTVGGLTFPETGTLHVAPLVPGATPPARHAVFDSATPINGPANLSGWEIDGIRGAKLGYNAARTQILFHSARGTVILLR
ncbi:MAG: hypothetical protein FWG50_05320 [Kiritimatiellaeota bacterium]|nr:hypothetical protein [Kiritimatiellota bacterium]